MALGSGKKIEALEAEVARLNQWIAHLHGTDAMVLAGQVEASRAQLADLQRQAADAVQAAATARAEEQAARARLVDNLDQEVMQEAGLYTFNHRLDSAVAYKEALTQAQNRMKDMVRSGHAIDATTQWTVNNSAAQGRKMVKDISTLMLRAYNAEADSLVRTLRPHTLTGAKGRLEKAAFAIERLGKMMSIRISPDYHRMRCYELELTADFLLKKEQEKEAERARRAELRDQQRAAAEMKAALEKLSKEQQHYRNLLTKLTPESDPEAWAQAQAKLVEINDSIHGVEQRAANIRTGHVYVISNIGAFGPDMVKIGMTRRLDPYDRVVELGDASVPFRFDVHAMVFHEDAVTLENTLHQALAHLKVNQVNPRREFFYATPTEIKDLLTQIAGAHLVEYTEKPDALEWHASGSVARATQQRNQPTDDADAGDALAAIDDASSDELYSDLDETLEPDTGGSDADETLDLIAETSQPDPEDRDPGSFMLPESPAQAPDGLAGGEIDATVMCDLQPDTAPPRRLEDFDTSDTATMSTSADQPQVQTSPLPPADWYPDPHGLHRLRFWDGTQWTKHIAP